jgi:hypothetical protein
MPKIKTYFRLNVFNGLFWVGQWDHYPSDEEIIEAMDKRFEGNRRLNGDLITFQVEKMQYIAED